VDEAAVLLRSREPKPARGPGAARERAEGVVGRAARGGARGVRERAYGAERVRMRERRSRAELGEQPLGAVVQCLLRQFALRGEIFGGKISGHL